VAVPDENAVGGREEWWRAEVGRAGEVVLDRRRTFSLSWAAAVKDTATRRRTGMRISDPEAGL